MSFDGFGLTDRTGVTASVRTPRIRKTYATEKPSSRRRITALLVTVGALALLAVALFPASTTTLGHPTNVGGNCGNCHPLRTTAFLTVNGLPTGSYTPGHVYTVTVVLADTNGVTGQNNFNFIIPTGGGTLATSDPNAMVYSATQVTPNHSISPMTFSTWTLQWTAPSSGTVAINVWAVMDETGATGINAPYDHNTITLTAGAPIPEFPTLLIPVIGIGLAVVVAATVARRSK